ncbi:MAG TPA: tryptophan halogenase family protein [Burkholderiaceae bacterium]
MQNQRVQTVVVVGGGTAGWMTAAACARLLPRGVKVRLVESDEISTVGVGEATIPQIRLFNAALGIDENDFIKHTQGTFKLGVEFVDWCRLGERYMHAFGPVGLDMGLIGFHHYWLRLRQQGNTEPLAAYSLSNTAAWQGRFMRAVDAGNSPISTLAHAFHFDAGLYARYLRTYGEALGVQRTEGKITQVTQRADDGFIDAVVMENGERIEGDLFVDCSGFRGLLIEQTLKAGYEDWSHWLPNNTAIAVPCENAGAPTPYTRATARPAGWQWRIPLQHRTGNGHVFSSKFMSEDEATAILLANLDGEKLAEPRTLKFTTGKRKKFWVKNSVAIGLSSGFMEPIESTSIHLIQSSIARLMAFFPGRDFSQRDIDEFNRQASYEVERIRDFLILHFKATERTDSPYWNACREMEVPRELEEKMALFRQHGRVFREHEELFTEGSWMQVLIGQHVTPRDYHPLADQMPLAEVEQRLAAIRGVIQNCAAKMPPHQDFIDAHCRA